LRPRISDYSLSERSESKGYKGIQLIEAFDSAPYLRGFAQAITARSCEQILWPRLTRYVKWWYNVGRVSNQKSIEKRRNLMRRLIFLMFAAALAALLPASVSADVKEWLRARVPGIEINIPNPMSRTGKPAVRAKADGNGVRRIGGGTGNVVVASNPSSKPSGASTSSHSSATDTEPQGQGQGQSQANGGVVIVPPGSGATAEIPSFAGTVVAVRSQRFQPLRLVDLESAARRCGSSSASRTSPLLTAWARWT
jgi:hypothetical protein